jgi:hypothetical protein
VRPGAVDEDQVESWLAVDPQPLVPQKVLPDFMAGAVMVSGDYQQPPFFKKGGENFGELTVLSDAAVLGAVAGHKEEVCADGEQAIPQETRHPRPFRGAADVQVREVGDGQHIIK